jgi:hypothetical protein
MKSKELLHVVPVEKLLQYNLSTQIYNQPEQVPTMDFCNGFTVRNIGTANVVVMGDQLAPNESKAISGNRGEVFVGRIDINFNGAGTTLALVTQKYYMNIAFENDSSL